MIFFDTTKTGTAGHRSGLTRVSSRLRASLGDRAVEAGWNSRERRLTTSTGALPGPQDWFLTSELFSEDERPGFTAFITSQACRTAAIFHDAIPLRHPHITWPNSVARHPGYMKLLARFDRVWAVSQASRTELLGFWQWLGLENPPPVEVLPLGADFNGRPRAASRASPPAPLLLCVGIVEPRKNQAFLLDVCEALWTAGLVFELHVVGRVNPHFGGPIVAHLKKLRRRHPGSLFFHEAAPDATVADLFARARATVFPTLAEGCGLPLLESLWMGVPCVCSDLPVLRENADGGGCQPVTVQDANAWQSALRTILTDDTLVAKLSAEACHRPLPAWSDAAQVIARALNGQPAS